MKVIMKRNVSLKFDHLVNLAQDLAKPLVGSCAPLILICLCLMTASSAVGMREHLQALHNDNLLDAIERGNSIGVQIAVECGADINTTSWGWGWTPLILAIMKNHIDTVQTLVNLIRDRDQRATFVNTPDFEGSTPLHYAAGLGSDERIVQILLAAGADRNATNKFGHKPIVTAK